jgi:hypothetical protein
MVWKCPICNKGLTDEEYHKEAEDVADGWTWEVKHKKEYCKKIN